MSYRKVLVGIFMAGFLCCGIGAGVMFQEYSSFQYMGEKRIGSNKNSGKNIHGEFIYRQNEEVKYVIYNIQ